MGLEKVIPSVETKKTNVLSSLSLEGPSYKSSDVSANPGISVETRKVKMDHCWGGYMEKN